MLMFWAFIGNHAAALCRKNSNRLRPLAFIMAAVIIGLVSNSVFPSSNNAFESSGWNRPESEDSMNNNEKKVSGATSDFDSKLKSACPDSEVGEGLAVRSDDAQNNQDEARKAVKEWLAH